MKYLFRIFAVLTVITANFYEAQQVVISDTISGTPMSMMMDKKVNDLLSAVEDKCATNIPSGNYNNEGTKTNPTKISVPERELTTAEICRNNPRIMGYKIQLTVVKSNKEADEVGLYFRKKFPYIKVEKDVSLRPNYKVMAGSYFNKKSAANDLSAIRTYFKDAIAVPYRVFCVEAK